MKNGQFPASMVGISPWSSGVPEITTLLDTVTILL
jgi:hypothetical protein